MIIRRSLVAPWASGVLHSVGALKHSTTALCISMMHKLTANNEFTGISFLFSCLLSHRCWWWNNGETEMKTFFSIDGTHFCSSRQDSSGRVGFQVFNVCMFQYIAWIAFFSLFVNLCRKQTQTQWKTCNFMLSATAHQSEKKWIRINALDWMWLTFAVWSRALRTFKLNCIFLSAFPSALLSLLARLLSCRLFAFVF